MRLQSVQTGDIVLVDKMHATVVRKHRGALTVRGICNRSTRRVQARAIEAHWRRAKAKATK